MNFKNGDVFRWSYTDQKLKEKKDGNNGGTTYWCCSQIAIYEEGRLRDTYWSTGGNKTWTPEQAEKDLELTSLGNIYEYRRAHHSERVHYLDKDCLDLNHSNSTSGNFYIRKDAKKDVAKMKRIMQRNIDRLESDIEYKQRCIDSYSKQIESLTEDSHVFAENGVSEFD